jgi:threonine/homoserine/homoserine lactone efflux protein
MNHWAAFVLASLVLAVTPGPGVLYVVTRTLAQGRGHHGCRVRPGFCVRSVLTLAQLFSRICRITPVAMAAST